MDRTPTGPRLSFHALHRDTALLRAEQPIEGDDIADGRLRMFIREHSHLLLDHLNAAEDRTLHAERDPDRPRAMTFISRLAMFETYPMVLSARAQHTRSRYFHDFEDIHENYARYWTEVSQSGFLPVLGVFTRYENPRLAGIWIGISKSATLDAQTERLDLSDLP